MYLENFNHMGVYQLYKIYKQDNLNWWKAVIFRAD